MPPFEEYMDEIKELWESHWLTNMGRKHNSFVLELKKYMKTDNIELLTNGHMALELTIQAYKFQPGSEIITTPFTFASTTHAIVRNGLIPVFCDIKENDYTIDDNKIESLITERTCAILPVHVYGNICNIEAIDRIAKKYNLKVIYDAAHTFGETYKGISVANYGDASCYSFHATKVFNSIEGGAVSYRDPIIGERLYDLKNFGIHGPYEVSAVGANAKMNEFCAAMGLCNLRHVDQEIAKRQVVYERYCELLEDEKGISINKLSRNVKHNYSYFPVLFETIDRNYVYEELKRNNILARKYFYPLTNSFQCYKGQFDPYNTPVASRISEKVLTLPMYADLELENVEKICNIIKRMLL